MMQKPVLAAIVLALLSSVSASTSQDLFNFNPALISTFGKDANKQDGDDDFLQEIFFVNRGDTTISIYARIFDPETYGNLDYRPKIVPAAKPPAKTSFDILEGETPLFSQVFAADPRTDSRWVTLTKIQAKPEKIYKLMVRGLSGFEGNLYDYFFSLQADRNVPAPQLSVYAYKLNVRQFAAANMVIRLPFVLPPDSVNIRNYDCDGVVKSYLSLPGTVELIALPISGSAEWKQKTIPVPAGAAGKLAFVNILTVAEAFNDMIFALYDRKGNRIPIQLPLIVADADSVLRNDFLSFNFDGRESTDLNNKDLSYKWDFGDGATSTASAVRHTFPDFGTYYVELEVKDNSGAENDFSKKYVPVTINRPPKASNDYRQDGYTDNIIEFSNSRSYDMDNQIAAYSWDFGDGATSVEKNPVHQYKNSGTYLVVLTVTDNSGSRSSKDSDLRFVTIHINNSPVAVLENESLSGVASVLLNGKKSRDPDGDSLSYAWDFGDGQTGSGVRVQHTYRTSGNYRVTLRVTDDSGMEESFDTDNVLVKVNSPPIAAFAAEPRVSSGRVHFSAGASRDRDGQIRGYLWSFDNKDEASGIEVDHIFDAPGWRRVKLTVIDDSDASNKQGVLVDSVFINKPPIADAGRDLSGAVGEVIVFDGSSSSDPDGELGNYIWDFGDGSPQDNNVKTTHAYLAPGEYTAKLTVFDKSNTDISSASDFIKVVINNPPIAAFTVPFAAGVEEPITFDGLSSRDFDGKILQYIWDFGDGTAGNGGKVIHRYKKSGRYKVSLKVVDNSGAKNDGNIIFREIHVNTPPVAKAGQAILQQSLTVRFDGSASYDPDGDGLECLWTFGDGSKSEKGAVVSHTYPKNGAYKAILKVYDISGAKNSSATDSVRVRINLPPIVRAGRDTTVAKGKEILFDASRTSDPDGDRLTFEWDFGDGAKATGAKVSHAFQQVEKFSVNLKVRDDSGISDNVSFGKFVVTVGQQPVANAGPDMEVKIFSEVQFDGSKSWDLDGVVNDYQWDFGDGSIAKVPRPAHSFQKSGVYHVKLTIIGDKLPGIPNVDTDEAIVTVHEAPIARAGSDRIAAENEAIEFEGSASTSRDGGIVSYVWDFGDGATGEGMRVKHAYAKYGTYKVRLTVKDNSDPNWNTNYDDIQVVINKMPEAQAAFPQIVNPGDVISFDGSGSHDIDGYVKTYRWDFGDGGKGTEMYARHAFAKPGTYTVSLTVMDNTVCRNNSHTITQPIRVNAPPQAAAGADRVVSVGDPVAFDGSASRDPDGNIASWFWSFGDGDTAKAVKTTHRFNKPGNYNVTLEVADATGLSSGKATDVAVIKVNYPPVAMVDKEINRALGEAITFDAGSSYDRDGRITDYLWLFPDGTSKRQKVVSHVFDKPGSYEVVLKVTDEAGVANSTAEAVQKVRINQAPIAEAGADMIVALNTPQALARFDGSKSRDPDGKVIRYEWDFGDGTKDVGIKTEHLYTKPGTYTVKLTVTDDSGTRNSKASDTLIVTANVAPTAKIKVTQ
jgi:PKD repeat protein